MKLIKSFNSTSLSSMINTTFGALFCGISMGIFFALKTASTTIPHTIFALSATVTFFIPFIHPGKRSLTLKEFSVKSRKILEKGCLALLLITVVIQQISIPIEINNIWNKIPMGEILVGLIMFSTTILAWHLRKTHFVRSLGFIIAITVLASLSKAQIQWAAFASILLIFGLFFMIGAYLDWKTSQRE